MNQLEMFSTLLYYTLLSVLACNSKDDELDSRTDKNTTQVSAILETA